MNISLMIAAVLSFLIGALHSILGERHVVRRLLKFDLPPLAGGTTFMRRTVWFAWHLTTLLFWGFGALLLNMSLRTAALFSAKTIIGWTFLVAAILALVVSRGRHFAWLAFGAIGVLALIG